MWLTRRITTKNTGLIHVTQYDTCNMIMRAVSGYASYTSAIISRSIRRKYITAVLGFIITPSIGHNRRFSHCVKCGMRIPRIHNLDIIREIILKNK